MLYCLGLFMSKWVANACVDEERSISSNDYATPKRMSKLQGIKFGGTDP